MSAISYAMALVLALAAGGCDSQAQRECDFVVGDVITETGAAGFRSIAMGPAPGGLEVFYSTADGLYRAPIGTDIDASERMGAAQRIAAPCDSLSLTHTETSSFLACGRTPLAAKDSEGTITVYAIDDAVRSVPLPWPIGRDHQGLSLAVVHGALEIAFHDGRPGEWKVWHARPCLPLLESASCDDEARLLSAASVVSGEPHLTTVGDERFISWVESALAPGPEGFIGSIFVSRSAADGPIRSRPSRAADVHYPRSLPYVAGGAHPTLFFRDVRRPRRRGHLFAQELRQGATAERVGRSNDHHRAHSFPCGDSLAVVTPRSYGRNDILVGIHLLDGELQPRIAEQQVYEWAARFVDVAGACVNDTIWLTVAEENRLDGRSASLHLTALSCH